MAIAIDDKNAETAETGGHWASRLDGYVQRAGVAAIALRALDQEAVDRIVWAMVVAGLESAVDLAELAMEETGFGVLEDKVVKNYIATEFLYDYLKDKRSVGVIDEDPAARASSTSPSRSGSCWRCCRSPTRPRRRCSSRSSPPRRATRVIFRPSARAARCAVRAVEILQAAGEEAGLPPDALQVIPDPTLDVSQYLFHHPGVDLIWTTGGPRRRRRRERGRQADAQRRTGQRARCTCTGAPTCAWPWSTCSSPRPSTPRSSALRSRPA